MILNRCTSNSLNCTSKGVIKVRCKQNYSGSTMTEFLTQSCLHAEESFDHMVMIHVGHIVIAEESKNSICSTIFIIVCVDKAFQTLRSTIKLVTIHDGIRAFFLNTHIHIDSWVMSFLINLLNHPRDFFIFIGGSIGNLIDIFKIAIFINLMKILNRPKICNHMIFHVMKHIQNISLTERIKIFILLHLTNKFICCHNHSGSAIADFFHQIVARIFNEAIKSIIQRLSKAKTIDNVPAIFCDVMGRSIINHSRPAKRTKGIFQNFCSGMRYCGKRFLVFRAIHNVHTRTDVFIKSQSIDICIGNHIRKIHIVNPPEMFLLNIKCFQNKIVDLHFFIFRQSYHLFLFWVRLFRSIYRIC